MKLTKEQRKSFAKTLHDCAKIIFALAIITPLISPEVKLWKVGLAFVSFSLVLIFAIAIEGEE